MLNRHRVLVISKSRKLRSDLVTLLSGYGYFVEDSKTRSEGVRKFRQFKQSIIIIDIPSLRRFSKRLFTMINRIQRNATVLIASSRQDMALAFEHLRMGAYDVLDLPLRTESLIHTIRRAQDHHHILLEAMFVKNVLFFGLLMMPLWLLTGYLLVK